MFAAYALTKLSRRCMAAGQARLASASCEFCFVTALRAVEVQHIVDRPAAPAPRSNVSACACACYAVASDTRSGYDAHRSESELSGAEAFCHASTSCAKVTKADRSRPSSSRPSKLQLEQPKVWLGQFTATSRLSRPATVARWANVASMTCCSVHGVFRRVM